MTQKKKKAQQFKLHKLESLLSKNGLIVIGILLVIGVALGLGENKNKTNANTASSNVKPVTLSEAGDLVIPVNEITEQANFYPVEVDGTELEVLAIKAPDGTIRTAFNTCQICYSSGRGYYVQSGDVLVCQNCGNRFASSEVEIARGGCNPVPIFANNKVVTDDTITISNSFLKETKDIFANWKNAY